MSLSVAAMTELTIWSRNAALAFSISIAMSWFALTRKSTVSLRASSRIWLARFAASFAASWMRARRAASMPASSSSYFFFSASASTFFFSMVANSLAMCWRRFSVNDSSCPHAYLRNSHKTMRKPTTWVSNGFHCSSISVSDQLPRVLSAASPLRSGLPRLRTSRPSLVGARQRPPVAFVLLNFAHQQEHGHERVDCQSFDQAGADDHRRLNLARRFRLATDGFHRLADGTLKADAGADGREAETDRER